MFGAVGTAIDLALGLNTMTDDAASTMAALGRHGVDGALKTVEGHSVATLGNAKRLIVVVAAHLASGHSSLLH